MARKPLYTDMVTTKLADLLYARICVKISLNNNFPKCVISKDLFGGLIEQLIEYRRVPILCKVCNLFGRPKFNKMAKLKQMWQVKV